MRTTHFPNVQPSPSSHRDASAPVATHGHVVLTGKEQHEISLADAARFTRNFREHADRGAAKGGLIERAIIEKILAQEACMGIRLYHGLNAKYQRMMVLVGVTGAGKDLKREVLGTSTSSFPLVLDHQSELSSSLSDASSSGEIPSPQLRGDEECLITLPVAVECVHRYQSLASRGSLNAVYFGREIFERILMQAECIGIRYYYALREDETECVVLVGVDGRVMDMTQGLVADYALPCPPICDWMGIGAEW